MITDTRSSKVAFPQSLSRKILEAALFRSIGAQCVIEVPAYFK